MRRPFNNDRAFGRFVGLYVILSDVLETIMYATPTKADLDRNLSTILHDAHQKARAERMRLTSEFAARGLVSSGALISSVAGVLDGIHKEALERASPMLRWFTAIALIAAAAMGLWTRLEAAQVGGRGAPPARDALVGLQLNDGTVIEKVLSDPADGVQLRPAECFDPAFLFPLRIDWVSSADVLQQSFKRSGYEFIDVYHDEIQTNSSRISRIYRYVMANISAMNSGVIPNRDRFHVQIYIKPYCNVNEKIILNWASAVLSVWS
jgi:hypothetical protein